MDLLAFFALCLFIASVPLENTIQIEGVGTIARLIGGMAAVLTVTQCWQRPIHSLSGFHKAMLLFITLAGCSLVWTISSDATEYRALLYAQFFLMVWMVWQQRTESRVLWLMRAYLIGCALAACSTIINYLSGVSISNKTYDVRYAATGFDANDIALTMALGVPITVYLMARGTRLSRYWYGAYSVLAVAAILLTASRTGILALAIALCSYLVLTMQSNKVRGLLITVIVACGLVWLSQFAPAESVNRLLRIDQEITSGTMSNRTTIWRAGWQVFEDHYLLGIGAGTYPIAMGPAIGVEMVAHNTYLSVLTDMGLIGFGVFMGMVTLCLRVVWRMPRMERRMWQIMMLALGAGIFALSWDINKNLWLMLGLAMAHGSALANRVEFEDEDPRGQYDATDPASARLQEPYDGRTHADDFAAI
jgi:O-antigen ligase